ncbi:MAG: glycosyltransferase [Acidobacteria bacterium]|nr:glycosyltransferase [Acidobacteriota bacterium]MBI3662973.1 glycosyltransferase [Acidobacteriota bacterium]
MPTLALSMIVRDAAADLPACLESVRGVADEIVVADTGSKDGTPEVASQLGARVISIPWENDFARARNLALGPVQSNWVLSMDADERLDPAAKQALPGLLRGDAAGYLVTIRNYVVSANERVWDRPAKKNDSSLPAAKPYPAYVEHDNVRLFRRDPEIYFVGRVHESVGPRVEAIGRNLKRANFFLHHFGMVADAATRTRKNIFYRELGRQKVQEMPKNAQAHFELGIVELDNFHNEAEAIACFERACQLNPRLTVAWFFRGVAQVRLGQYREAIESLREAESRGHRTPLLTEMQGDAHYNLGEFEAAARCYRRAFEAARAPELESKLGQADVRCGRTEPGLNRLRRAAQQAPESAEIHDRLIAAAVWKGRLRDAAEAAETKLNAVRPQPGDFRRAASIRAQTNEWERVIEILRSGLRQFPQDHDLSLCLAEAETEQSGLSANFTEGENYGTQHPE